MITTAELIFLVLSLSFCAASLIARLLITESLEEKLEKFAEKIL
jgi:hypothetical protein